MKNLKKILALVLAFACAFTMFAGAAFTDQADINADNVDAVDLLTTLNIISGYPDGTFDPEGTVDRAEMAKMIYTIRNGGNDDDSAHVNNTTSFTDINGHWAEGYIKYLQNTGIVAGKSATTFAPDVPVTTTEAMKMALALAGYDEKNAELTGPNWSKNTLTLATTIGLTDNVNSAMTAGCTRQDAAQILANVLSATAVRYSAVVENFVNDSKTGLSFGGPAISVGNKWMDLFTNIGTLVGVDGDKINITMTQSDAADSDDDTITEFIDLDTDYSDLLGQKVKVLFSDGKNNSVIGIYATVDNTVYTVEANDTSKDEEKVAFGGASYRLDDEGGIVTYVDGDATAKWTSLDQLDHNTLNPNMYTFVDTDDNGRLDTLVVRTYDVAKVSYVASDRVIAGGYTYKYDDEIIADGIEKDDWVTITHDMFNDCWSVAPVEVQSADLDAMRNDQDGDMYFDGAADYHYSDNYDEYQIGDNWYAGGQDDVQSARSENDLNNVKAVQSVDYVAVNGVMFYIERSSGENNGRVDNVAVVLARTDHRDLVDQARIAFFNGDTKVVNIESKSVDIQVGSAYEYDVIGDEYRFSYLEPGIENRGNVDWEDYEEYYGDLTFRGFLSEDYINRGNDNAFDNVTVDDNAQVLLYQINDTTHEWDVVDITGKTFKNLNVDDLDDNDNGVVNNSTAYGFSGEMNGLDRIGALAIRVDEDINLHNIGIDTWNYYGYILTNAKWVDRNNGIAEYELFTNGRIYTVHEEIDNLSERVKNTVLGFDELTEYESGNAVLARAAVEDVEEGTYGIDGAVVLDRDDGNLRFNAITKVSNDGDTVIFDGTGEMDISDATIIYVDSRNNTAITDGDVKVAVKNYNVSGDPYMANALYIASGNVVELLVVDQGLYLESDKYNDVLGIDGDNTVYGESEVVIEDDDLVNGADVAISNIKVARNGALTATVEVDRAAWMAEDAAVKVSYDIYVDGAYDYQGSVNVEANRTTARIEEQGYFDVDPSDIEIVVTDVTPAAVNVRYVDEDNKPITLAASKKTLSTEDAENLTFTLDAPASASTAGLSYTVSGTNNDGKKNWTNGADDEQTISAMAKGTGYVTVTIKGLDTIPTEKVVSISASQDAFNDNVTLDSLGEVNAADKDKKLKLTAPESEVSFTEAEKTITVSVQVNANLKQAINVYLNNGEEIMVKAGETTGSKNITFTSSKEIAITSVEAVALPEIESVKIVKSDKSAIVNGDSYAAGDKIVITFSEKMKGTLNTIANVATIKAAADETAPALSAEWDANNTQLILTTSTDKLVAGQTLTIGTGTCDIAADATGNAIAQSVWTVQTPGSSPVEA